MNEPVNPFAAPRDSAGVDGPVAIVQAGQGARLINLIVDYLGQAGVGIVIGVVAALVGGEAAIEQYQLVLELEPDHAQRVRLLNQIRGQES